MIFAPYTPEIETPGNSLFCGIQRLMQLVPVIDLKAGQVVRAYLGRRDHYAPLVTPLAPTSAATDVVEGFLRLFPFPALYVADLDAIDGRGTNQGVIEELSAAFPRTRLWLDAGARDAATLRALLANPRIDPVIGAESLASLDVLSEFADEPRVILSLDFRGSEFLGPPRLLETPGLWPARVIVMTLAHVGADMGPDLATFAAIKARASDKRLYAAGGARDARDLDALRAAGAQGALVASMLHKARLAPADLARLAREQEREP